MVRIAYLLVLLMSSPITAATYCPLVVRVFLPSGIEVEAWISVQERNGRVVEREHEPGGTRFCDLGILPVTVTVRGDGTCNQVVVRDVPLRWGITYTLKVILDRKPCLYHPPLPPVPLCEILFRVADEEGNWIEGAGVEIRDRGIHSLRTDEFGRARWLGEQGTEVIAQATATGRERREFKIPCNPATSKYEQLVILRKKPTVEQ